MSTTPMTPQQAAYEAYNTGRSFKREWSCLTDYEKGRWNLAAHAAHAAQAALAASDRDKLMERSVLAMSIAEGDEGWKNAPIDCPMLEAVYKLRFNFEQLASVPRPTIKELLAGFAEAEPKQEKCPTCVEGRIVWMGSGVEGNYSFTEECPTCHGTGEKEKAS